jgi:hypothetical protein
MAETRIKESGFIRRKILKIHKKAPLLLGMRKRLLLLPLRKVVRNLKNR